MTVLSDGDLEGNPSVSVRMDSVSESSDTVVESSNEDSYEVSGSPSTQPSSYDLHLGDEIKDVPEVSEDKVVVDDEDTYPEYLTASVGKKYGYTILPNEFVLATTKEVVDLDSHVMGQLHGRSSVGRLGLFVHNAGLVDAGYVGQLTLELYNASPYPIELKEGMRICQLTVHTLSSSAEEAYNDESNKYQKQNGVTPSKLWQDFD